MTPSLPEIRERLAKLARVRKAQHSKQYLKSPYSFYGIPVPELRKIAKEFKQPGIKAAYQLFDQLWLSGNHEEMSLALFILENYRKFYDLETWQFIMQRLEKAKTWDHVDELSAHIIGIMLLSNPNYYNEVISMSASRNPWFRRTSIVSTYPLIKKDKLQLTFRLAENLIYDDDIYVQKGAGWMLREAGKRNRLETRQFIFMHKNMKTFALSYATEKMPEVKAQIKEEKKQAKQS
jgi:3-methyladenine DNA glycosylase AlkD